MNPICIIQFLIVCIVKLCFHCFRYIVVVWCIFFDGWDFIFRNLREMFKLDAAEYMMSICGDDGLRELSSPGKSGSIFYLSHDDRFVIKTLKRYELKVLYLEPCFSIAFGLLQEYCLQFYNLKLSEI